MPALVMLTVLAPPVLAQDDGAPAATPPSEAPSVAAAAARSDADPVVIQVGAMVERLSDVEWRFEVAVRSYAAGQGVAYSDEIAAQMRPFLPTYLEQRGIELVLLREASRRGLEPSKENVDVSLERIRSSVPAGQDYQAMLANAGFDDEEMLLTLIREGDLISQVIAVLNDDARPTEEALRVRYLADIERYTEPEKFCARHILVADEALASDIVARLEAGEDFAALAAEFGTDGTAAAGGDLGCFGRGAMVAEFEDAVVAAEIGQVSGPVQTQFGYHALLVYEHQDPVVMTFADVRDEVSDSVTAAAAEARLSGLIKGSAIVTYPERVPGL